MPYETKEELLALAKIDPELDAVGAYNSVDDTNVDTPCSSSRPMRCQT